MHRHTKDQEHLESAVFLLSFSKAVRVVIDSILVPSFSTPKQCFLHSLHDSTLVLFEPVSNPLIRQHHRGKDETVIQPIRYYQDYSSKWPNTLHALLFPSPLRPPLSMPTPSSTLVMSTAFLKVISLVSEHHSPITQSRMYRPQPSPVTAH